MTPARQDSDEIIRQEASQWFARLRSTEVTPDAESAFSAWVKQSPRHELAFKSICAAWEILGELPIDRRPPTRNPAVGRRELIGAALAASIAGFFLLRPEPAQAKVYQTAVGEQKRFTLSDGSRLLLDTASKVSVMCDGKKRSAVVACGRAHFEVAGNVDGEFVVDVQDISVASRRGIFDVLRGDDRILVFLQQNDALVQTSGGAKFALHAGERLTIPLPQGRGTVDHPERGVATAWQRGILVFDRTTLEAAVREMNRYSRIRLTIRDPKIAQMKISGAYGAGKTAEFLNSIALLLPVRAEMHGGAFEIASSH